MGITRAAGLRRHERPDPEYRHVPAQIRIDGLSGRYKITGESISVSDLPDFAQGHIEESVRLPFAAAQLEAAVHDADDESKPLRIALPMSVDPARASTVCSIPTTFRSTSSKYNRPATI